MSSNSIPVDEAVALLRLWFSDWDKWKQERDELPLNHKHRGQYEALCNTQHARIQDLVHLIKKYSPVSQIIKDQSQALPPE